LDNKVEILSIGIMPFEDKTKARVVNRLLNDSQTLSNRGSRGDLDGNNPEFERPLCDVNRIGEDGSFYSTSETSDGNKVGLQGGGTDG
jgi:hypothetical protein